MLRVLRPFWTVMMRGVMAPGEYIGVPTAWDWIADIYLKSGLVEETNAEQTPDHRPEGPGEA